MSTYNLIKRLYREIDDINAEIDMRIIKGLSYKTLSSKHRMLMEKLRALEPQPIVSRGFMNRLAQYASVFLM